MLKAHERMVISNGEPEGHIALSRDGTGYIMCKGKVRKIDPDILSALEAREIRSKRLAVEYTTKGIKRAFWWMLGTFAVLNVAFALVLYRALH